MPAPCSFDYAIVRVVPHVEREEFINAGVIVFCDALDFLAARVELSEGRLLAIAPRADIVLVRRHLEVIPRICDGGPLSGPIGTLSLRERWRWLVAPRSTVVQLSPSHGGIAEAPHEALERLLDRVVRVHDRTPNASREGTRP